MGKVERITEKIIENEQEIKELMSKQNIEDLYEFFLAKDSTLTEEEFDNEVYDILEYYSKNMSMSLKELEESETEQIAGGKSGFIKKSLSASLCALTLTSGINVSASTASVNPFSQKAVSVWNNKKQDFINFGKKIKTWVAKNKKALIITGSVTAAVIAGIIITVVVYKNKKNVKQPKDNVNVPIKQTVGQPNNKSEQQNAEQLKKDGQPPKKSPTATSTEQPKKDGQPPKKSSATTSDAKSKPTATPAGQPPKKPSTATSTVHGRVQAAIEAQEDAENKSADEIRQRLGSRLTTCKNLTIAINGRVEKAKTLVEAAESRAASTNGDDVAAKLDKVNQAMEKVRQSAQTAQEALKAAEAAKDLKSLEEAYEKIREARDSAENAVRDVECASKQLNACINGDTVDDIAASKNPPNPLGRSRSVSMSGPRPDAGYESSTVKRLTKEAEESTKSVTVGGSVAAIEKRDDGSAVSPVKRLKLEQQEQQKRASQEARRRNCEIEIVAIAETYKDHEKEIGESFKQFKLARKGNLQPNEISTSLRRFQEEQMRIERCLKNLETAMKNFKTYKFESPMLIYDIIDMNFTRYRELVKSAEEMFMEECKNDIYMNNARNQVRQELEKRFEQDEDS